MDWVFSSAIKNILNYNSSIFFMEYWKIHKKAKIRKKNTSLKRREFWKISWKGHSGTDCSSSGLQSYSQAREPKPHSKCIED